MSTLSLLKERLQGLVNLEDQLGTGAFKALNAIRDYEEAGIINLDVLKIQCQRIKDEHFVSNLDTLNEFDRKLERDEIINQIIQEFDKELG